ncbi:terminase small subunit [Micromonospora sp. CA-246542]|uniref:terminase small subunit n=1 Tax=Micromonospora sp. CA-246542 TaxID=3239959 RepID=UPI003D8D0950
METGPMESAFKAASSIEPAADRDKAAVELGRTFAEQMDLEQDAATLIKLGDSYLRVLEALQMTPRARALAQKGMKGNDPVKPQSRLDELRERRSRKSGAKTVDAASS